MMTEQELARYYQLLLLPIKRRTLLEHWEYHDLHGEYKRFRARLKKEGIWE
jgi:hypothetical protein